MLAGLETTRQIFIPHGTNSRYSRKKAVHMALKRVKGAWAAAITGLWAALNREAVTPT